MSTLAKQTPKAAAPNLADLYKPLGIQAVTAAAMCFKQSKAAKTGSARK
ncbi:hypothetical protein [Pannonibacter indicus]|jgi:hypothetical protein|uniref:Uncharacterized protein n=1 Tax=Pannonibacter indicus TaxID=466044 RepID=A0A0K6HWG1_9HYPH|nr:hypothetical protein [Pannonibacter indicus]CUA95123.1 hypothetical protein Ga0061067_103438 [Pannonibacter indicus]